jgi:hypothetical protein
MATPIFLSCRIHAVGRQWRTRTEVVGSTASTYPELQVESGRPARRETSMAMVGWTSTSCRPGEAYCFTTDEVASGASIQCVCMKAELVRGST